MDLAGQHLLAGSILASDQDVGVRTGNLLDNSSQLAHRGALAPVHRL